jgi:TPR repeat protein
MNRLLLIAAVIVLALPAMPGFADGAAGLAAYDKGDYEAARELLKPEAERGDPVAQVKYGLIFAKGLGVPHDGAEAFKWFEKSAAQGNAEAMYCVGVAYDVGDVGAPDRAKAAEWYRKSAEQGFVKAQYNLGQMLQKGDGIPADPAESVKWLQKAADKEYGSAEFYLALAYIEGLGVEENGLSARYWAERAEQHKAKDADRLAKIIRKDFARSEAEEHVPRTTGGDGTSLARAIMLPDQKTEESGIRAENTVIAYFYPGWRKTGQSLTTGPDQHPVDIITVEKDGKQREIYFDIVAFFGHLD